MNLFDLYAKITLDTGEYEDGLDKASEKTSTFGDVLKANLASEAVIAGVKKLASVVSEIGKAAYTSYSQYEQLAGGTELMFGDAYAFVAEKAKNAYKTVQMSQNDYLQQVNGFATGLKTALNGNAQAAAELADRIITAEADVVAATGNTQEAVQNAFNGIMKSNYTMLDNLQLGITPTKEGFQELIDKVNEWNAENGKMSSYTIDNLADCESALVDYIEMQGLAGYAAAEAAGTIEGSTASMKAAWENLSKGMADETADMSQLTKDFVDSAITAGENIAPRVKQIVSGIGDTISELIPAMREADETVDNIAMAMESAVMAATPFAAAMGALTAGQKIKSIASVFKENAEAIAFFRVEVGHAAFQQEVLAGTFSVSEVAVGVLTGKISLATAAQAAWNKVLSANPIGFVVAGVAALGVAAYNTMKKTNAAVDELTESLVEEYETSDEAAEAMERLKDRLEELESGDPTQWGTEKQREYEAVRQAIKETEEQLASLQQAEAAAAAAAAEAAEAAADPVNVFQTATEQYVADATALYEKFVETYEGIYNTVSNWFGLFDEAKVSVETNVNKMMAAMQSQIDFNTNYAANLQMLKEYGLGSLADAFQEYGANGAAYAQAIVDAVEKAGGATTEGGKEIIQGFADMNQQIAESQGELSKAFMSMNEEFGEALDDMMRSYDEALEGMNKETEAREAALSTFNGFKAGIDSEVPGILDAFASLGDQITKSLQGSIGSITIPVYVESYSSDGSTGSFKSTIGISNKSTISASRKATGMDYVPYDDYLAYLHKGEAVLTAREAAQWRSGDNESIGNSKKVISLGPINIDINGVEYDNMRELARNIAEELEFIAEQESDGL